MANEVAALKYDGNVPKVIAKGKGKVADKILEEAKKNNIPIHKDDELASMLNQIDLGNEIPPELYDIVANILVFVGDIDKLYNKM